jgi:hypothetical protein
MSTEIPTGLRQARTISILFGIFLILNALRDLTGIWPRWKATEVTWPVLLQLSGYFYILVGSYLLLPWKKLAHSPRWAWAWGLLTLLCVMFAFAMITEVMAKNYIAQSAGLKAKPPVFQAILLFAALAQPPITFFLRRPDLLD